MTALQKKIKATLLIIPCRPNMLKTAKEKKMSQ